jgi:uncharacterized membrane protein
MTAPLKASERLDAVLSYIPVVGWLYVGVAGGKSAFARFHLKQSIGLALFVIVSFLIWVAFTWILSWIPFGLMMGVVFFTLVMVMWTVGLAAWVMGVVNAAHGKLALLPIFGRMANRLWS